MSGIPGSSGKIEVRSYSLLPRQAIREPAGGDVLNAAAARIKNDKLGRGLTAPLCATCKSGEISVHLFANDSAGFDRVGKIAARDALVGVVGNDARMRHQRRINLAFLRIVGAD